MKNLILFFILLILINTSFSLLCIDSIFDRIFINMPLSFRVQPTKEVCYKYKLTNSKNKISLTFSLAKSYTAEVVIYKSPYEMVIKNGNYINAIEKYLIVEHTFKEIDVSDFYDYVYIIIRDTKEYFFYDNIILYDSEVPILLAENTPLEMENFMSNNKYTLTFSSTKNLQFVYSSKNKSQKLVTIYYNNNKFIEKIDNNDIIANLNNEDSSEKDLIITIENKSENKENQDFSVIVYEKKSEEFFNINNENMITTYYIKNEFVQNFYFYSDISNYIKSSSVNFKFDYITKENNYINIISDIIYSDISLNSEKFIDLIPQENKLKISYDLYSDEYLKIYFSDKTQTHKYKYILIKIEIKDYLTYYSPNYFTISLSEELEEIDVINMPYYTTKEISKNTKSYIPLYYKLLLDPQSKYIFTAPYQDYLLLRKGDLMINSEINNNYLDDKKDIIILTGLSELTVEIFGNQLNNIIFHIEKINSNEVYIIENERDNNELEIKMDEDECNQNKKKFVLGSYDKDLYEYGGKKVAIYWMTSDGEMSLFYKNSLSMENQSLFPSLEINKKLSEISFILDNHIDLFTITCAKPGTLYIKPLMKTFNENTHIIGQNSISTISITTKVEILQLTSPINIPSNYLYLSILPLNGKSITITPDTSSLFNEVTIGKNTLFMQEIDVNKYKTDQLAIKISSDELPIDIEVIAIIHYDYTEYLNIDNNKNIETVKNNFVKFISKNVKKLKIEINGLNHVPVAFGIVKLSINNINYIPVAYNFEKDITKKNCSINEIIEINNKYYGKDDLQKKYQAFVFSIQSSKIDFKYKINIEEIIDEKGTRNWKIVLIIVFSIILLLIIVIIILLIKKKKGINIESINNEPLEPNKKYILNDMKDDN